MKKFVVIFSLLVLSITPVLASNWVQLSPNEYIDTYSIRKENYMWSNRGNYYSLWIKYTNNCSPIFQDYTTGQCNRNIHYSLSQYIVDCENKKIGVKGFAKYNEDGETISSNTLSDYQVVWDNVIPDSKGETWYNYACQYLKGGY